MKDWKTSLAGILKLVAVAGGVMGVTISPEQQTVILEAVAIIYAICSATQAYFTKDKD